MTSDRGTAISLAQHAGSEKVAIMDSMDEAIVKNLKTFVAFARKRVADPHLAEDLVQESLLKALAADRKPEDDEHTVAWFYRILRRTIIDLYRRRAARSRALDRFEQDLVETPSPRDARVLCGCFMRLLPAVPQAYRELLEQVDIQGKEPAVVAQELGLTRNNLTVRLHRARRHLREALTMTCRACSKHGCLDCTCGESGHRDHPDGSTQLKDRGPAKGPQFPRAKSGRRRGSGPRS